MNIDYKLELENLLKYNQIIAFELSHNKMILGDDYLLFITGNLNGGVLNINKTVREMNEEDEEPSFRFFSSPKLTIYKKLNQAEKTITLPRYDFKVLYDINVFNNESYREIYECISVSLQNEEEEILLRNFKKFGKGIQSQLNNDFYKDVDVAVNIQVRNKQGKVIEGGDLTFKSNYNKKTNDIVIQIFLNADGTLSINHKFSQKYLEKYEDKWKAEAKDRGLDVDVDEMRKDVINFLNSELAEKSFKDKFLQNIKAWWNGGVATYIEAIQATQKVTQHIWEEGTINRGVWHSVGEDAKEYQQWPEYMHLPPLIGGAVDGVIDEVTGMAIACKSFYEIACDEKKREGFKKIFTKEGFSNLVDGLKQQAKEFRDDPQIQQHFAGQTIISIASMFTGTGAIGKLDELDDLARIAAKKSDDFVEGTTTLAKINELKKLARHIDNDKAIDELIKEFGSDTFENHLDELLEAAKEFKKVSDERKLAEMFRRFALGRRLETNVTELIREQLMSKSGNYIKELAHKFGKSVDELAEMPQIRQLQIELPNGAWTVLDDVFVETVKDTGGKTIGHKLLVNETKLSNLSDLTVNQKEFLKLLKSGTTEFVTRSKTEAIEEVLTQGTKVTIEKYVKTIGNGLEDTVDLTTEILF